MKNGTKGHTLYYTTYLPKDTITEIEIQNEKILELLSKKWTIYRVDYERDAETEEILRLDVHLKKEEIRENIPD
jgi:hypothetical protein